MVNKWLNVLLMIHTMYKSFYKWLNQILQLISIKRKILTRKVFFIYVIIIFCFIEEETKANTDNLL